MRQKIKDSDVYHFEVKKTEWLSYIRCPDECIITMDEPTSFAPGNYIVAVYGEKKDKADIFKFITTAKAQDEQ